MGRKSALAKKAQVTLPSFSWADTTTQRISHAARAGLTTAQHEIMSPNGFATGVKYRKIDSPIDVALNYGWIDERMHAAGMRFMHLLHSAKLEPRMIANLEKSVDGSRTGNISDHRVHCMQQVSHSIRALPPRIRPAWIDWTYDALHKDVGIAHLGCYFSRAKHLPSQLAAGKKVLREVLLTLAKQYGL